MSDSVASHEARDMAIAALALLATFLLAYLPGLSYSPLYVGSIILAVLLGFTLHELGHRFAARALGYYAFFRAWRLGIVLSVLSGLLAGLFSKLNMPIIPIIAAPGAVYVIPRSLMHIVFTRRDELIISSAGPLMNILLAVIGLAVSVVATSDLRVVGLLVSRINAWLAVFNLLPLPPLDGYKIARSSVLAWLAVMIAAGSLLLIANYSYRILY